MEPDRQQVRIYCRNGRIPGAIMQNGAWMVPEDAVRPTRKERSEPKVHELQPTAQLLAKQMIKKQAFDELYQVMNGKTLREMDEIINTVCSLCRSHQQTGFVDGIKLGVLLSRELNT